MTYYLTDRYAIPVPELDQAMKLSSKDLPLLADRIDASIGGVADSVVSARVYTDALTAAIQPGVNLWNPATVRDGFSLWDRAQPDPYLANSAYHSSGPVLVTAGQQVTIWGAGGPGYGDRRGPRMWAFYDLADQFVQFEQDSGMPVKTVTAPQDGFLRAAFLKAAVAEPMIENGPTATEYEPYRVVIDGLDLGLTSQDLPDQGVTPEKTTFVRRGKNILDPAEFELDTFLANRETMTLAGYTTSGFAPVEAGEQYVGVVRIWYWFRADGSYIDGINTGSNTAVSVQTAPADAAYVRASWSSSRNAFQQIEKGSAPTAYEPYGLRIPELIVDGSGGETPVPAGPVTVTLDGDSVSVRTLLGDQALTVSAALHGSHNGAFNLLGADLDGVQVTTGQDDIAPLRTFNTVGANHGYTAITTLTAPGHGKATADLGSVWTDGVTEWTLLLVDGDQLTLGPDYTVDGQGVVTAPAAAPSGPLTHVSGATNTGEIPVDQVVAGAQLYPSVQRVYSTLLVDGAPVSEGEHHGVTAQVRESYEVLDYASIIDTARANIGTPFYERRVRGAVRVENTYTFKPGLVLVDTALTELRPTALGSCGFVQAIRPAGTGGRIVPGVTGWTTPKSFADTWTSEVITTSDLIDPAIPPVMSLDVMDWGGFALGYFPYAGGVTSSAERIEHGASRLWDLRSTQKSYPSPWAAKAAGWGRVEAHAYRAYLTPAQAGAVAAVAEDAHAAHSALAAVTGL